MTGESVARYIGIDPGTSKCGFAVEYVDARRPVVEVVAATELGARIDREIRSDGVLAFCVGDATSSSRIVRVCEQSWPSIPIQLIDETNSTLQARALYYQDHPPRGLLRLVPRGLLLPREPLDGYAALIIIRRFRSSTMEKGSLKS